VAETRTLGLDVSRYEGIIKWDVVAAHVPKIEFIGIRSGIGSAYQDSWFNANWLGAKAYSIPRTPYHVFYPWESSQSQLDNWARIVGKDLGELPWTIDAELPNNWTDVRSAGLTTAKISDSVLSFAKLVQSLTGHQPLIYSRAGWVNEMITGVGAAPPSWLDSYEWWLAQYLFTPDEHPGPPTLPHGVSRWLIHQTTEKGLNFGTQASVLDYDRWNPARGKPSDFVIGGGVPIPVPPLGTVQVITNDNIEIIVIKSGGK
jgi:GH25 family lysozyme M1 (1,4-beta-N-acetylmuramidase)